MEFYTDTNFDPTKTDKVALPKPGGHLYSLKGYGLGGGINGYSYFLKIDFNLDNVTLSNPTCFAAALIGSSVGSSMVKMDGYNPVQVKNGVTAVPFDITLQNCIHVRNIETKLKSNKVGSIGKKLLANTLTGSDAAKGAGVLIEGLKSIKSVQMVLEPNDPTSVYKDYETEDDITGGIYPDKGNGISQPLHLQTTLKQDGNTAIEPGDFEATSTFQVTYP